MNLVKLNKPYHLIERQDIYEKDAIIEVLKNAGFKYDVISSGEYFDIWIQGYTDEIIELICNNINLPPNIDIQQGIA